MPEPSAVLDDLVLPERPALILPTHYHRPDYVTTLGPEVADLCRLAGYDPDPEQAFLLDDIFGMDARGKLAAFETAIIAPRQNIKTGLKKQAALGKIFLLKRELYVWTAHEFPTTQEAFRDLTILIESTPEFDRRVKRITRGNGDESIETDTGRIIFRARTKAGGRGLSGDDVGYDEAFALQPEHIGATMPLLSTRPNPQVGYWSSACLRTSKVLHGIVRRGRAKRGRRLLYAEYCYPGEPGEHCERGLECDHGVDTPGCSLDDLGLLQVANTQAGGRIAWQYLLDERQAMSATPGEYGRERAGWHDKLDATDEPSAIDLEAFRGLLNPDAKQPTKAVLALAVAPGRKAASIGVAGDGADGKTLVFVKHFTGTAKVVSQLERLFEKRSIVELVLSPRGHGAALLPAITEAGVKYKPMSSSDLGAACVWFQTAVADEQLEHGGQADLLTAVGNAKTRTTSSGEGEMWDQRDPDVDITAVQAAAMAGYRWGVSKKKPPPAPRKLPAAGQGDESSRPTSTPSDISTAGF